MSVSEAKCTGPAAHADDIEIGCGGTLLSLRERLGERLKLIYVMLSKEPGLPQVQQETRRAAATSI